MSSHESIDRQHETKGSSDRFFGLTFFVVFLVVALWPLLSHGAVRLSVLGVSLGFLAVSLTFPVVLAPLNRLWLKFGMLLHSITSPIILGVMFYLVITPIGLLMRALRKDLLRLKYDLDAQTYWIRRDPPGPEKQTLDKQF